MLPRIAPVLLSCAALLCALPHLQAWNAVNHRGLTRTIVEALPPQERALLGKGEADLLQKYCLIPDTVRADKTSPYLRYVTDLVEKTDFDDIPLEKRQSLLHVADRRMHNAKLYAFYTTHVLDALKRGDGEEASIYLGTFLHFLEDSICPAHLRFGGLDTSRTDAKDGQSLTSLAFFKRFIAFPKAMEKEPLHKRIDRCEMALARLKEGRAGWTPRQLGTTRAAFLEAFAPHHEAAMASVDRLLLPLLQALAAGDDKLADALGEKAGLIGVCMAADYCHTLFALAQREAKSR